MKNSRIVKLLSLLDKNAIYPGHKNIDEIKDFRKWLNSPWTNGSNKLIMLYNALIEHYPEFPSSRLSKQNLFSNLYPEKPYHDKLMRNHLTELAKQLDAYFAHSLIKRNSKTRKEILLESYFQRENTEEAIKLGRKELKTSDGEKIKGADDHLKAFYIEKRILQSPTVRNENLTTKDFLGNLQQNLDSFYAIQKIKILADKRDRQNFTNDEEVNFQKELEYLFNLVGDQDQPIFGIYKILLLDQLEDYARFEKANTKYQEFFDRLTKEDQKLILVRLQNILIDLYSRGSEKVVRDIFELSRFGISTKLLVEKGKITDRTFNNVVSSGNQIGAFEYVRGFIDNYYNKIDKKLSKDIKSWADAHYLYYKGEYDHCVSFINKCTINNHLFSNRAKTLELMAYFQLYTTENIHLEILTSRLKAFERNIQRNKVLAKNRKASYLKFISYLEKLVKLLQVNSKKNKIQRINKLEKELTAGENIFLKFWLLKQLKKLREDS